MTCSELELLLCDYIDGTLRGDDRAHLDQHLAGCAACRELLADSRGVLEFIERVPEVEVPPVLVSRILQQAPSRPVTAGAAAQGFFGRLFEPILQPRLVMGMAMTVLSFAMLGRFAGIEARQLRASDLSPVAIWEATEDRAHRTWTRAVKYYQSLKIVYELQNRLQELTEAEEPEDGSSPEGAGEAKPGSGSASGTEKERK